MELYLLFQQLFLTAFVTLLLSFLFTKFFSTTITSPTNSDHVMLGQKGDQETVKLNKVLKVSGTKSKRKRVRFADDGNDQVVDKVGNFSGFEGSVGEFIGGLEVGLKDEGQVFDGLSEVGSGDVVGEGSGEVVRVVEELGIEERCESSEIEGGIVDLGLEKSVKLFSDDDVSGEGNELVEMVVEEMSEDNANERNLENQDLSDVIVEKKNSSEEAVDDAVFDQSGEFEVGKESVEDRSYGDLKEGDVFSAAFDEKTCIEEADNEKKVGLDNDDVLGDHTGGVKDLKDLVSAECVVSKEIKQETIVDSAIDEVVINEMIVNEVVGDETSMTLASEGGVVDQSGEVRVIEVSQGTGVEVKMDKGNNEGEGLVIDEDDDWEGIERSDLEKVFAAAANYVDNGGKVDKLLNLGNDEQMQLYALHKVAMEGPCYEGQPMALKISARAKWNAWQRLGNMSPEVAMEQYVSMLSDKDPGWMEGQTSAVDKSDFLEFPIPGTLETINKQIQ